MRQDLEHFSCCIPTFNGSNVFPNLSRGDIVSVIGAIAGSPSRMVTSFVGSENRRHENDLIFIADRSFHFLINSFMSL